MNDEPEGKVAMVLSYTDSSGEHSFMYLSPANGRWYIIEGPVHVAEKCPVVNLDKVAESIQCP